VLVKYSNGWWYDAEIIEKLANPEIKGNKKKKCLRVHFKDVPFPDKSVEYKDVFLPAL